jgi:hypothetical protein
MVLAAHARHADAPSADAYVPGEQATHAVSALAEA